jgi:O-acetyl-ADP-ribose deacetylase (regulator of RNase III)
MKKQIGNILEEVKDGFIIQQVNCQGVMGSGIAKAIRDKWPVVYTEYARIFSGVSERYWDASNFLGQVQIVNVTPTVAVINLFTQENYGRTGDRYTSYDALDTALKEVARLTEGLPSSLFHHPTIGCGLGGGNWKVVSALIEQHLGPETTLWLRPEDTEP